MGTTMATSQDFVNWVCGPGLEPEYLKYVLLAENDSLLRFASGTTHQTIYYPEAKAFHALLPPVDVQRAVVRVLGALDDKIELNRKMNATLEAMARALFKSWFVQEPEADWKTAPLAEWVDVLSGGTPSKSNAAFWGGPLKWISPKAMTSIHADECDDHVSEQAVGNGTRIAPKGSTLVMVRGMGLHDGVRVSQAREDVTFNQDVKALVPRTIEADLLLFAMLAAQEELHKRVETSGHGTGKMPSEILLAHPITMPPREVQRERAVHISALNARIAANRSESRSLARMRDDLLPQLLSGELPVDAVQRAVEEVA
jgi:type I restriction enzyme S subunit